MDKSTVSPFFDSPCIHVDIASVHLLIAWVGLKNVCCLGHVNKRQTRVHQKRKIIITVMNKVSFVIANLVGGSCNKKRLQMKMFKQSL